MYKYYITILEYVTASFMLFHKYSLKTLLNFNFFFTSLSEGNFCIPSLQVLRKLELYYCFLYYISALY